MTVETKESASGTYLKGRCNHGSDDIAGRIVLLSIGNELRSDDGVACRILNALQKLEPDICFFDLACHTGFIPECLPGHSAAIIVDATCNGASPGDLSIVRIADPENCRAMLPRSSHSLSLSDELSFLANTGRLPAQLYFIGIEVASVDWLNKLSPTLEEKMPKLLEEIRSFLHELKQGLEASLACEHGKQQ